MHDGQDRVRAGLHRRCRGADHRAGLRDLAGELADCIKQAQLDGAVDAKTNPQALATTLLAFMRGLEALHKGGAKPAQIKSAAEEMIALIPKG